ncbi:MAG TPA: HD domain-containing phosphohydrolase [Thermoanaerobaculia bacterium]|nr:HD domain-containing phosphohydrolase [Thermoanaerobaculia bacterium]
MTVPALDDEVSLLPDPELLRRLAEYESLLEISSALSSTLDLARVLDLALVQAEAICRAETSSIWELDEERGDLFFRVVRGRAAKQIRDLRVPLGRGIVGSVAASGQAEMVNDVAADPRWRGDKTGAFRTRAILAVPLLAHGKVVGVLQMLNPLEGPRFLPEDLRRMQLFAGVLAPAIENARLYAIQRRQFENTVTVIADAIEKRDPYTGGHVRRVVAYCLLLGTEMGLSQDELGELRIAATLHDFGKIATPDAVLRKPAPLDAEEAEVMRRHPADGAEIFGRIRELKKVLPGVRHHHERHDGSGYPDGLAGEEIALVARIIAVADTFDAMTTSRPYRLALDPARAASEIEAGAGSQFCPTVVAAFLALYGRGEFHLKRALEVAGAMFPATADPV